MLYFLLHDFDRFRSWSTALATSWRRRTFTPVISLAADFEPIFAAFTERFHLTPDERPLLIQMTVGQSFDRRLWRHVAGELLLYAAADAPAIQTAAESLTLLVSPDQRETIRKAHAGCRDLAFDGVPYRPGLAGLTDAAAVVRLTDELARIDPAEWDSTNLSEDDPTEELAFARACFDDLRTVYEQARRRGQIVVCEDI